VGSLNPARELEKWILAWEQKLRSLASFRVKLGYRMEREISHKRFKTLTMDLLENSQALRSHAPYKIPSRYQSSSEKRTEEFPRSFFSNCDCRLFLLAAVGIERRYGGRLLIELVKLPPQFHQLPQFFNRWNATGS